MTVPAPAAKAALEEATRLWPGRSRLSDGIVGDPAHQARTSDHNADADGMACAFDVTHDPAHGVDAHALVEELRRRRDPRVKYIISRGRIAGPGARAGGWEWRPYTGPNRHDKHAHVSITQGGKRDTSPWWAPPAEEEDVALVDVLADPQIAGGVWALLEDGTVRPFRGARSLGEPKGHDYWAGRTAQRFEPVGDAYAVIATSGERYGPGFEG